MKYREENYDVHGLREIMWLSQVSNLSSLPLAHTLAATVLCQVRKGAVEAGSVPQGASLGLGLGGYKAECMRGSKQLSIPWI